MESDILVEGFRSSEQAHGICYMRVIGDGDSSLMANLQQLVAYGPFITKIECANHVCKELQIEANWQKTIQSFETEEV